MIAKTIDLLKSYNKDGLRGVINYINNKELIFYEETWVNKIKKLIDNKNYLSAEAEIALVYYKFKF